MKSLDRFPPGVSEKLKYYVYRLVDPRNGETFYVGKGKGDRLFQHVKANQASDVIASDNEYDDTNTAPVDDASLKIKILREIRAANLEVIHIVHRHGIVDSNTAYEVEAALIDAYAGLSNIAAGHHSHDRGPMHARQIADEFSLPEAILGNDKLILININSSEHSSKEELLDRVRYAWRISLRRAQQADYVAAVIHGVIRGVFVPEQWMSANDEHFSSDKRFGTPVSPRLGFKGRPASDEVWAKYVGARGKRLPEEKRHGQNPVRYHNC